MRLVRLLFCACLIIGSTLAQAEEGDNLDRLRAQTEAVRGTPRELPALVKLYEAERNAGNPWRAAQVRDQIFAFPGQNAAARITVHFLDAAYQAQTADFVGAQAQWDAGTAALAALDPHAVLLQRMGSRLRTRQDWALAALQLAQGHADIAATALERALASNAADIKQCRAAVSEAQSGADQELAAAESDRANLLTEQINLDIAMGRTGAAELVALDWLKTAQAAGKQKLITAALKRYGDVLIAAGRFAKALARFDEVLARQREQGIDALSVMGIRTRRSRAQALMGLGRWQDAYDEFHALEQATKSNQAARNVLRAGNDRALARAMIGRLVEAERIIDGALAHNVRNFGSDHPHTRLTEGLRALVLARFGRDDLALPLFRRYVETWGYSLASADPALEESALAQLRHHLILEHYLAVLARRANREPEAIGEAFRVADALRAGNVQQAVTAAAARANAADPQLAALLREDQDLGYAAAALYRTLGEAGKERDDGAPVDIGKRLRDIEARRAQVQASIRRQFPDYAQLVRPTPPLPADVARLLAPQEALLSITTTADASYVFAVAADGRTQLYVAPLGDAQLAALVRRVRAALDVGDIAIERLPPFDTAAAYALFHELLQPLQTFWQPARQLIVSTGGSLGQIPFGLLVEQPDVPAAGAMPFAEYAGVHWLVRDFAIAHVPSAATLLALRHLPAAPQDRQPFVGFGDPDFGGNAVAQSGGMRSVRRGAQAEPDAANTLLAAYRALAPLPDTREEILGLAHTLGAGAGAVYLGAAATRTNAMSPAVGRKAVLAFATHGLQPGDLPGLDQPALAMALGKADGASPLLTLTDVLGLKLNADWVVLSACNTAGADGIAAEALSGLGRGFFFAGARALLVTHWPVESESARKLVSATFVRYARDPRVTRAQALRSAQLDLMQQNGQGFSYAHPLFWAPYALIGDGGR